MESFLATKINPGNIILTNLPILPPTLRPFFESDNGTLISSDINSSYRLIITQNNNLATQLFGIGFLSFLVTEMKRKLQEVVDNLIEASQNKSMISGVDDQKPLKGLLDILEGKYGHFRQYLLGKRVDYSARSVIVSGPGLRFNQCGLPYDILTKLFQPQLIKKLLLLGNSLDLQLSLIAIKLKKPFIFTLLKKITKSQKILLNRAPTLHKYGIQSFEILIILNKAIHLHPLVCGGFNADFDGDQMGIHLPLYETTQLEISQLMKPSTNFFSLANSEALIKPTQDMVMGCYYLTYQEKEIIQQSFENFGTIFTSSLLDSLKNIGFYYSTSSGVSLTIEDLKIPLSKDYLLADVSTDIKNIEFAWKNGQISNTEKFKSIVNNWELISDSLKEKLIDYYKNYDPTNSLYLMAFSGARGNISQVRQVVGMRGLMVNQRGNIIQLPILTNFKEGLSTIDYIISSYGARKGIIDTALRTADAGYLTRRLIYLVQDISIRDICCNSNYSLLIDLKKNLDNSLLGRTLVEIKYLQNQKRVKLPNLLITQSLYNLLKKNTNIIQFIKIRSSLTCNIPNSLCQYCYGWDLSKKKIISLGDSVGIMAAHSIGEPGTQLTMRTFHTGGIFIGQMKSYFSSNITGKISLGKVSKQLLFENRISN
eukprot:gene7380-7962_t